MYIRLPYYLSICTHKHKNIVLHFYVCTLMTI